MWLSTKNYGQQVPLTIARIASDLERADEILLEDLRTGVGQASRWPADDEVRQQVLRRGMYGFVAQPRIAMILAAVEQSMYSNKVEALQVPKKLSIEHIMPQVWAEHWPLPSDLSDDERDVAVAARNERLHLLGNLTLTTLPLNAALSNAAWPVKQKELNKGSKLLLNAELIEDFPERFDEQAIDQRGAHLADRILSIWPGPTSW